MKTTRRGQRGRASARSKGAGTSTESSSRKSGKSKQVKISSVLTNKKQKFGKAGTKRESGVSEKQPDVVELSVDSNKDDVEILEEETKAGAGISERTRAKARKRPSNGSVSESKGQALAGRKGKYLAQGGEEEEEGKTETETKLQPKDQDFVSHTYIVVNENAEEEEHTVNELSEAEKEMILEEFDLDPTFGPCRGITRMERLQRVYRYRFLPQPPHLVAPILRKCYPTARFNTCIWDQRLTI